MCGRSPECTSLPEPSGPTDEQFVYQLTEEGLKLLTEHAATTGKAAPVRAVPVAAIAGTLEVQERRRRRGERARKVREDGRRPGTVSALRRDGAARPVPYLRIAGEWLRQQGFEVGCDYEMAVTAGRLTIQLLQP
jgi:Toxin SymE, type I toxin-antitoxin system